jgi:DNA-binding MarR family transcriptional regulator
MDQNTDQLALLTEIKHKLDQMERDNWARAIEKLDIAKFALDLRKARSAAFPEDYFPGGSWDILLALDHAGRSRRQLQLADVADEAGIAPSIAQRYVDLLMTDGFLYQEEDPADHSKKYILLTDKGAKQMAMLFSQLQVQIAKMAGLFDVAALQGVPDKDSTTAAQ